MFGLLRSARCSEKSGPPYRLPVNGIILWLASRTSIEQGRLARLWVYSVFACLTEQLAQIAAIEHYVLDILIIIPKAIRSSFDL
jgi:hypothetical protein